MDRLRNTLIGVASVAVIVTFLALNTRITHASGGPVVVQILGTASTADVNNPDLQPVQFTISAAGGPGSTTATQRFVVPAGKRLIIDDISAEGNGGPQDLVIDTSLNGTLAEYVVFRNQPANVPVDQLCHIYADPQTGVFATSTSDPGATSSGFDLVFYGHYVNVP